VPNAGTSRKGVRGEQCNGFPDQLRPTEPGRPGLTRPDLRSSSSGLRRKLDGLVPVSALNLRGGGGLTPNDLSRAAGARSADGPLQGRDPRMGLCRGRPDSLSTGASRASRASVSDDRRWSSGAVMCAVGYQASGRPSRKKPPVGPSSSSRQAYMTLRAPSGTGRPPPPISEIAPAWLETLTRCCVASNPPSAPRHAASSSSPDSSAGSPPLS
jgi:hypothetical protein